MAVPVATVDVRQLNTLNWGPIRAMFPSFVEEIELARFLKDVLSNAQCRAVQIEPHRDPSGIQSTHIYDIVYITQPDREP
jgi:hypothetical protein